MDPAWLGGIAALLGPLTGAVTGAWTARRTLRTARAAGEQQSLTALHAGYQSLLDERATYTREVLAELAAVKTELHALRVEHLRVLTEIAGLRAHLTPPTPVPARPDQEGST
ncbi:uncharacterized protein YlxW (UPF0749 family) [Actinokineospora baliensis]|uniref:hypothetical protein n=1 Tax=Actinokineospora baliensis TaxID=547056 RepID=UPI00195C0CE6|nr:hypothetical protein [Actinokineospora baliensis]MBM7771719.1 uncharacterized protein YlxW (UPF0749 family) [Actinokineospora baliensis]